LGVARRRLAASRLDSSTLTRADEVVRWLGAVQAQDHAGASWGVAQRAPGVTERDVVAIFDAGRIVRTHALRPTWHLLTAEDVRWVQRLTAARVHVANGSVYRRLNLGRATLDRGAEAIADALRGGRHLVRAELAATLEGAGIALETSPERGVRLAYLVMFAELEQVVASGPMRGKQHTYALLDERVPPAPDRSRDEDLAALAGSYLRGRGPATAKDLSWWSGLTVGDTTRAIELAEIPPVDTVDGRTRYAYPPLEIHTARRDPAVHLLPNFDELFIGLADRRTIFDPTLPRDKLPAGIFDAHVVTVDGRAIGGWRRRVSSREVRVDVRLATRLDRGAHAGLAAAAKRYAAYLDRALVLEVGPWVNHV
jgi:hypothetical protein